jgi:hypothetical protein
VNGISGCNCKDPRLPEGQQHYDLPYTAPGCYNNISVTPASYGEIWGYVDGLKLRIYELEQQCERAE